MLNCMMTNSTQWAYHKKLTPKGIVIHSSGRNNPYLRQYVQPSKKDKNYANLIMQLGENRKHNDWNHIHTSYNFHYWVGKDKSNDVVSVQTFPLNMKTWNDDYIHICICEDKLQDKTYLINCLYEVIYLCYVICKEFNWDEKVIHDHSEISDFPDSNYWLKKHKYSVQFIRAFIFAIHNPESETSQKMFKGWQTQKFLS